MNAFTKILAGAALVGSVAVAAPASATPYSSFFGLGQVQSTAGNVVFSPSNGDLFSATSLTFGAEIMSFNGGNGPAYSNGTAINFVSGASNINVSAGAGVAPTLTVNWTVAGVTFTFTSTQATYTESTTNGGAGGASTTEFLNFSYFGNVTNNGGVLDTQSAILTETITQAGINGGITEAGSFTTPAPVPEPVSMAVLGMGLLGLAAARRKFS